MTEPQAQQAEKRIKVSEGVPAPFVSIERLSVSETLYAKICLYGVSGVGKTSFLITMPQPQLLINFEKENILPLRMARHPCELANIDSKATTAGYEQILRVILMLQERSKKGTLPAVVCLDTGAGLYSTTMRYILKAQGKETPTQPDWGLAHERMKDRINDLLDFPCHLLVIFHEQQDKDAVSGRYIGSISVPGKELPGDLMKKFNMCLHYTMETGAYITETSVPKRLIHTVPSSTFPANDKTGALNPVEEPDFSKMWAKVQAKLASTQPTKG